MSLNNLINAVIDKGIVVRVLFTSKSKRHFKYITRGKWLPIYGGPKLNDSIVDAILHVPTSLDENIDTVEYVYMPVGFNLRWFLTQSGDIRSATELFKGTTQKFIEIRQDFNQYLYDHTHELQHYTFNALKDEFFIRNYPTPTTSKTKKQLLQFINQDIISKYFTTGSNVDEIYTLPACTRIGLAFEHFKSSDIELIKCCKRKWYSIIKFETNTLIGKLKYEIKALKAHKKTKATQKAINQINLYIKMLQGINRHCLKKCSSIEETLSFWPSIIQPKPLFVYDR